MPCGWDARRLSCPVVESYPCGPATMPASALKDTHEVEVCNLTIRTLVHTGVGPRATREMIAGRSQATALSPANLLSE